ncbi:MAG: hypothetical protein IIY55_09180, partial [Blautia sp.]|nr:hypothetical protein [Blautia sp.]
MVENIYDNFEQYMNPPEEPDQNSLFAWTAEGEEQAAGAQRTTASHGAPGAAGGIPAAGAQRTAASHGVPGAAGGIPAAGA